jgi:ferritin-like metal-binding protein YciE
LVWKDVGHIASLLQETLEEEGKADHLLTEIAEQSINPQAATM